MKRYAHSTAIEDIDMIISCLWRIFHCYKFNCASTTYNYIYTMKQCTTRVCCVLLQANTETLVLSLPCKYVAPCQPILFALGPNAMHGVIQVKNTCRLNCIHEQIKFNHMLFLLKGESDDCINHLCTNMGILSG